MWINQRFFRRSAVVVALKTQWAECQTLRRWSWNVDEVERSKEWKLGFWRKIFSFNLFWEESCWIFCFMKNNGNEIVLIKCKKTSRRRRSFGFLSHNGMILLSINTIKTHKGFLSWNINKGHLNRVKNLKMLIGFPYKIFKLPTTSSNITLILYTI